jgi:hypothetical protein
MSNQRVCPKAGIKIHNTNNYLTSKLTKPVSFEKTVINTLDLDIDNYSLDDLFNLFNIVEGELTEETLKKSKNIVLKMHPDKSKLDSKYFIFFSNAYKRLFSVYEFQNKSIKKQYKDEDLYDTNNNVILDNMFADKKYKDPKNFNNWFNQAFEKHSLEDPNNHGYGDWLKSNDGFMNNNDKVTKENMNEVFENQKKQMQNVVVYTGVTDMVTSMLGGSLLDQDDRTGGYTDTNYTDLQQAYTETLIPVTMDDYNKIQKFNNIGEYKAHREGVKFKQLTQQEANNILLQENKKKEKQSQALAYKYAKELEKNKEKQKSFWSEIKQITGW